jgi:hypothetical protein
MELARSNGERSWGGVAARSRDLSVDVVRLAASNRWVLAAMYVNTVVGGTQPRGASWRVDSGVLGQQGERRSLLAGIPVR